MRQLSLFDPPPAEPAPPPPPDIAGIRKHLRWRLRWLRGSTSLPWTDVETRGVENLFPQLARYLPDAEGDELIGEFRSELTRLRATD